MSMKELKELFKRSEKKKRAVYTLARNITRMRMNYRWDMKSDNERTMLNALAVGIMDKTAERVGNNDSASNGHYGVTGLKCHHIKVRGNQVRLQYIGKSGVKQDKRFSDKDIAGILKKRVRECKRFIFETSDGRKISPDSVNRYLSQFDITAKDIRGYLANRFMVERLKGFQGELQGPKERKKVFLKEVKAVSKKVGHTKATLRKHYLLPKLETNYIERGILPRVLK